MMNTAFRQSTVNDVNRNVIVSLIEIK
jgi:hypothetical protein